MEATLSAAATNSKGLQLSELPGHSRLFNDLLFDFRRVADYYDYDPSDPDALLLSATRVDYPDDRRKTISRILELQNGGSPALERFRRPGTVAILTGQQVGLFGGPCYTVYKALTAVALAKRLCRMGVDAVPIFWMATEDHDLPEVNHCWVFDRSSRPIRIEVAGSRAGNTPVGGIPIPDPPIEELRNALSGLPYADDVLAAVEEAYVPGQTFGLAFVALLKRILGERDLLFFDPMNLSVRTLAAPIVARAVRNGPALTEALLHRNRDLQSRGYHTQVHVDTKSSLVFLLDNGQRIALRRDGDDYLAGNTRFTGDELAVRGTVLSPNALLRPVVQDCLFPTSAYVGGPAELAYFAQNQVLYRELLGRAPMVIPRGGATVLDKRTQDLLTKNGLRLPDLHQGESRVKDLLATGFLPADLANAIGETRLALAKLCEVIAQSDDPRWFSRSRTRMEYQISKVERRIARDRMALDERASKAATEACNLVYPRGHPQERFYCILPFLAQFGFDLIESLKEEMSSQDGTHTILVR